MMNEPLIFDKKNNSAGSTFIPEAWQSFPEEIKNIPLQETYGRFLRKTEIGLPSLSELEVVRHFARLARMNFCVDTNFYPLGSCTMKYSPKVNEEAANMGSFAELHPLQSESQAQGLLNLLYDFEQLLCKLTGMQRFSFQPAAGAHGELTGMLMIRKYFESRKDRQRNKMIVPDSSHGTNPASAAICGFQVVKTASTPEGLVDIEALRSLMDEQTAGIMLTNPNTLGLFEEDILRIQEIVHSKGGLVYYDGANFNALLGLVKPSRMGFDIAHLNLHKTFSAPHGGGGPGSGAVGATSALAGYLPMPLIDKKPNGKFFLNYRSRQSIGRVRSFYGNIPVLIKAFAYLLRLGSSVKRVAEYSVLNAAYVREKLKDLYQVCSEKPCMHETVFSAKPEKENFGISAMDIAKRLIDFGIHPPTVYFPLVVKEALMIEPTETESRETLDFFIEAMQSIHREMISAPDKIKSAPLSTHICRPDETRAARLPDIRWSPVPKNTTP